MTKPDPIAAAQTNAGLTVDPISHRPAAALYVHVPFCKAKCRYCDFYSVPLEPQLAVAFVSAAKRELEANLAQLSLPLRSIFLGGGTPVAMGANTLQELLSAVKPLTDSATEVSVEANPGLFDAALASALLESGVNRVNFGVQSFDNGQLGLLGRIHSACEARQGIELARKAGLNNVGLDLIYGIPDQSLADWRESLKQALSLGIGHLSCYALSYEPQTPLGQDYLLERIHAMPDSLQKDCYDTAIQMAAQAGLEQYEISNFARPGRECAHNITYWNNRTYLGIGPAAVSYLDGVRKTNTADLSGYIRALQAGRQPPSTSENLSIRGRMAETLMLGLRMLRGVDRSEFSLRFGQDPVEAFPNSMRRYAQQGALLITPAHVRLAPWVLFFSDTVLADIVTEA